MSASSRAPSFQADTRYQSVIESYYRELNRQGSSQRKPEVLDAIHELLVIGMPLVVDENVLIEYASIYEATPDLLRFAKGAAGGTTVDQQAVMRQMVTLLANRKDLPPEFAATVKQAFKEALRESEVTVTSPNPSRRAVGEIESREN